MEEALLSEKSNVVEEKQCFERWSSYQYVERAGSIIPTASLAGTEVSVDEIRSATASSYRYYHPSLHAPLMSSPEPNRNVGWADKIGEDGIPMLLKMPRMFHPWGGYSIIGFGDIIVSYFLLGLGANNYNPMGIALKIAEKIRARRGLQLLLLFRCGQKEIQQVLLHKGIYFGSYKPIMTSTHSIVLLHFKGSFRD